MDYNKVKEYYKKLMNITDTCREFEVALLLAECGYMIDDFDMVTEAEMEAVDKVIVQNCEILFDECIYDKIDEIINIPRNNY